MQIRNNTINPAIQSPKNTAHSKHFDGRSNDNKVKAASVAGSAIGIGTAIAAILYKLKKGGNPTKFMDLKYSETDAIALGLSSVAGGLIGGAAVDKKENRKSKVREALQQMGGCILAPVGLLAVNMKLLEKSKFKMPLINESKKLAKSLNPVLKGVPRIVITLGSLFAGMEAGNFIMTKINNKIFKENVKHEVEPSDYTAHADDICFASTFIFKNPVIQKITSKILPATFLVAGYKTGTHTPEKG